MVAATLEEANMSVDLPVAYVQQSTTMNCWAASTAMLVGYRDGQCLADTTIVDQMSQYDPSGNYHDGATQPELGHVAQLFQLSQVYPVCQDAHGWEQWLNDHGPLLIQVPGNAYHSIVVTGVKPDEGQIHVLDPWNGDGWISFDDLNTRYEMAGAGWENNVYALH